MNDSPLNAALRQFEATEANLAKIEGENHEYEENCRSFYALLESLPKIDQWKPEIYLMELDEIAQNRLDAQEIGWSLQSNAGLRMPPCITLQTPDFSLCVNRSHNM